MDHFGGHVIESARAQLGVFAFACQHSLSGNHGVRLVSGMPMLSDVDRFRGADEHAGSMRCRINTKKTNFRRFFSEIGIILSYFRSDTFLKIGPSLVAAVGSVVCARMLVKSRSATTRTIEKGNFVFMIGSINSAFRFHKKSCPILGRR